MLFAGELHVSCQGKRAVVKETDGAPTDNDDVIGDILRGDQLTIERTAECAVVDHTDVCNTSSTARDVIYM